METIICKKCGSTAYTLTETVLHNTAFCANCGAYIKHVAKEKPTFHFGKYNGQAVDSVNDILYMEWVLKKVRLSARMRKAVAERVELLKFNTL